MRTVEAMIRELSQNDVPVLVVAEHGSGKAAVAARIHSLSRRAAEPSHLYQGLEASEEILAARDGQSGTVYLQEVGDLTAAAQNETGSPDWFEWRRAAPRAPLHLRNLARVGA